MYPVFFKFNFLLLPNLYKKVYEIIGTYMENTLKINLIVNKQ